MMTISVTCRDGSSPIMREKRRAPKTKSSWSTTGRGDPGGISSRRFMKESIKSPINAPSDNANPSKKLGEKVITERKGNLWEASNKKYSTKPTRVPITRPAKNPRKVLCEPNIGFPSKNLLPPSIRDPPPKITGIALAQ